MFLHGDGRTNLIFRSSLISDTHDNIVNDNPEDLCKEIKAKKIKKCIINPPYENNKPILFVKQALEYLEDNGKLIVIMPTPTLQQNRNGFTETILKSAKLDFVIKMPDKLFTEQKRIVNTSIFGFTKTAHKKTDKVLFYDLEDDGFESVQHKGRIDKYGKWEELEEKVFNTISNSEEIKGICQKRKIIENNILDCYGFSEKRESIYDTVKISDIFLVKKGTLDSEKNKPGDYDFITAAEEWKKHKAYAYDCEALVIATSASGSLGRTHYVNGKFTAATVCSVLTPKPQDKYKISLKFYSYYFNSIRSQLCKDLKDGTSKNTINPKKLKEYEIQYIPYETQLSILEEKINKFEELKKELKLSKIDLSSSLQEITDK